jgi:hypothetical protein
MGTTTQTQRVLQTLRSGKTLTTAQARTRGIGRLSARIFDLRSSGVNVNTTFVTRSGVRTARYSIGQ